MPADRTDRDEVPSEVIGLRLFRDRVERVVRDVGTSPDVAVIGAVVAALLSDPAVRANETVAQALRAFAQRG